MAVAGPASRTPTRSRLQRPGRQAIYDAERDEKGVRVDLDWAAEQCDLLVTRTNEAVAAMFTVTSGGGTAHRQHALARLNEQGGIVRQIAHQVAPDVLPLFGAVRDIRDWSQVAGSVLGAVKARRDHADKLGPSGPVLAARSMHPKVWQVASAYWDTGLYDDAVEAAAKVVRAEARAKVGKSDLDESTVGDLFSPDDPKPGMPRLRFPNVPRDDAKTWEALHRGALHFTKGAFLALRNPRAHLILNSGELQALEELAAFSLIARWIDGCDVATTDG